MAPVSRRNFTMTPLVLALRFGNPTQLVARVKDDVD
jgi:hypothetical protein